MLLKWDLDVTRTDLGGWFDEQKLEFSCSFRLTTLCGVDIILKSLC